jgi:hypothetical protein
MAKQDSTEAALARETAELYGLPADEFTAARNARAKELKPESPELAAALAKVPKPSAAAAAVNRLARREPSEVRALIQAGKRLRQAQEDAVAGRSSDLQAAVAEHRAALERVQREARKLKLSAAVLERVVATMRAASVDPELQLLLERGLLAHEVEGSGFSLDPGLVAAAPARKTSKAKQAPKPAKPKDDEAAKARLRKAKERLAAASREAAAAQKNLARAERDAARAAAAVAKAEEDVRDAERALG